MRSFTSNLAELARTVIAVIIGVVLALILITVSTGAPGHPELIEQQQMNNRQLQYISCLLLIPPEDRIPEAVASCQVDIDSLEGG